MISQSARSTPLLAVLMFLAACGGSEEATDSSVAPAPTVVTIAPVDETTTTEATTTTETAPAETTIPPLRTVATPPVGICDEAGETPCIQMTSFTVDGDTLVAEWDAFGFEPSNGANHAHFYWNTFSSQQVGTNASSFGVSQGSWELTDQQPWRSTSLSLSSAPDGATGLCVTAANGSHGVVDPGFFQCEPIATLAGDLALGFIEIERTFVPIDAVCIQNDEDGSQAAVATAEGASPWVLAVGFDGTNQVIRAGLGSPDADGWPASSWTSTGEPGDARLEGFALVGPETNLPVRFAIERDGAAPCDA